MRLFRLVVTIIFSFIVLVLYEYVCDQCEENCEENKAVGFVSVEEFIDKKDWDPETSSYYVRNPRIQLTTVVNVYIDIDDKNNPQRMSFIEWSMMEKANALLFIGPGYIRLYDPEKKLERKTVRMILSGAAKYMPMTETKPEQRAPAPKTKPEQRTPETETKPEQHLLDDFCLVLRCSARFFVKWVPIFVKWVLIFVLEFNW